MVINIDATTVVSSGVTAMIIGIFQVIGVRYSNRLLDRIEKDMRNLLNKSGKSGGEEKESGSK